MASLSDYGFAVLGFDISSYNNAMQEFRSFQYTRRTTVKRTYKSTRYVKIDLTGLDRVETFMARRLHTTIQEAIDYIVNDINNSWYGVYPPASVRGGPPAIRTGMLKSNIKIELNKIVGNTYYGTLSYLQPYSVILENPRLLERPFLEPALERAHNAGIIKSYSIKNKVARP